MTSYELLDFYEEILNEMKKLNAYTEELSTLNSQINTHSNDILNLIYTNGVRPGDSNFVGGLDSSRSAVINSVQDFSVNKFDILGNYQKLIRVKDNVNTILSKYSIQLTEEKDRIINILDKFDDVTATINEFLRKRENSIIVQLVTKIYTVVSEYNGFINCYENIKYFMLRTENKIQEKENEKTLKLHFYDEHINPKYFVTNIEAIYDSYEIMCQIFNISSSEYELKVLKIESGSLLGKFIGSDAAIDALAFLIKKVTELIFNKFTFEGKILRHKKVLELLKEDAEVVEKYKELGYEISFNEDIDKYHFQLVQSIGALIGQTTRLKINDQELSLQENIKEKYLSKSNILLLKEPNIEMTSDEVSKEELKEPINQKEE